MGAVLLNVDLGELPDEPESLYACAQIANVACGGHAGDDASIRMALDRCARHGVAVGAHPSYPDCAGFGRRRLEMEPIALERSVAEQCARLLAWVASARAEGLASSHAEGLAVAYVKPHGALYHAAADDPSTAGAVVRGVLATLGREVTVLGSGARGPDAHGVARANALADEARRAGLRFAREGFADRGVRPDGTLVPRGEAGALIRDPVVAAARAIELATSGTVDTICVHGDAPGAVAVAHAVRAALDAWARGPGRRRVTRRRETR